MPHSTSRPAPARFFPPALALAAALCSFPAPWAAAQDLVVREWLVRGPIPADTGRAGVLRDYLGTETTILPDLGDSAAGGLFVSIAADSLGRVDLNDIAGPSDWSAAYVHAYVFAPTERSVLVIMDSDDDLVAWLNGQRVWVHVVPRGIGLGSDTVRVRLAKGWNSLFLKVINRTGGFGVLGKLAAAPGGGGVDDLRLAARRPAEMARHNYPSPTVSVGPLRVRGRLSWADDALRASATVPITAWGSDTLRAVRVRLIQGSRELVRTEYALLPPGELHEAEVELRFRILRLAGTAARPVMATAAWDGGSRSTTLFVDPEPLLRLHGAPVVLARMAAAVTDSTPAPLGDTLVVPGAFDGLEIELHTVGLGPNTSYRVNDRTVFEAGGVLSLCAPCRAGDTLSIEIEPDPDRPLWLVPYARVKTSGYAEYADGYRYARGLTGEKPPITQPDPAQWLATLGTAAYQALTARYATAYKPLAARIRADTLLLIGNSHIDAAWLWRWQETRDVIRDTWRTSLKLAQIFPGYVFAASSAAYYDMLDRWEPDLADSLVAAVRRGSWAPVGGWWVEADMNLPSGESLVRQGLYGQRYFQQRFGRRSRVAWTPDTFGYPWTVPQILRQSGFDFFVTQKIRWSDSTDFPYNAFYWEGRDGTRIFTYNPYGYVHDLDPSALVEQRVEDRARTGGRHQIVLYGVGDHGGGPTIAMLQRAEDLRRVPTFPVLRYSAPEAALQTVATGMPEDSFAVWRDELYLEYHRGTYTTQAAIKRRHRESEIMLQTAEALAAFDTVPYPRELLELAWRRVLFNQFHDILPGSGIDSIYPDAHAWYDTARTMLDPVIAKGFAHLRSRMDTRGDDSAYVVFNPLGWERSGLALDVGAPDGAYIHVSGVPPLGAKVVRGSRGPRLSSPEAGADWIENAFLRVEIDTLTGNIVRLYDKRNGRDMIAPGGYANALQVLDDRPQQWDAWNVMPSPETWPVTDVRRTGGHANGWTARYGIERVWGNSTFRQTLILHRHSRYLDVDNSFEWHERRKLIKVAFAFDVTADSATYEIPYGTIGRSGYPRTKAERAKFEVPGQRWADVSGTDYGISILNDAKYGWDYHDGVLRLSLLKAPIWPDSTADRGRHEFRFAIYPHAGDWRAARTDRVAAEYNVPMIAAREQGHAGVLGEAVSFASLDAHNAQLAWIKRAEDSDRLVLRIVEWHGLGGEAIVTMHCPVVSARRANLLEDRGPPLPVDGTRFPISLRPYEIATVLVECMR